jgi:hypothetical protein
MANVNMPCGFDQMYTAAVLPELPHESLIYGFGTGKAYGILYSIQSGHITISIDAVMEQVFERMEEIAAWYREVAVLEKSFRSVGDFESVGDLFGAS